MDLTPKIDAVAAGLRELVDAVGELRNEVRALSDEAVSHRKVLDELAASVGSGTERLDAAVDGIEEMVDSLASALAGDGEAGKTSYRLTVARLRSSIRRATPLGSVVAVVSKGDPRLLDLHGRTGVHFPQGPDGSYAGHHPADDAVVGHLQAVRARGADFFTLPEPALWWLDHYADMTRHLASYTEVPGIGGGRLWDLRSVADSEKGDPLQLVARLVAALDARSRDDVSVLDWDTGLDVQGRLPAAAVFRPIRDADKLPYLDGTADIVMCPSTRPLEEAIRVASVAVVVIRDGNVPSAEVAWTADDARPPEITVVVAAARAEDAATSVRGVGATLKVTTVMADAVGAEVDRAAADTDADIVVFVEGGLVPIGDWLSSLVTSLATPGVAAVIGSVVGMDGVDRRTDPPLMFLATRLEVFKAVGGFGRAIPGASPCDDYRERVERHGGKVVVRPDAVAVDARWPAPCGH